MNGLIDTLRSLGATRLLVLVGVGLASLAFLAFVTTRLSTGDMALLYSELAVSDSAAISAKLEAMKVPYSVSRDGTQISVPADQVGKLRMAMAQDGLPTGGSVGYEIFDKSEGFGTTSFIQNINHLRALEGELARTIGTISQVQQARVHLVLPRRELFSRTENAATASVFLKVRGATLKREQITAIQHLVAAAVPQLEPTQVAIIDDHGVLLARGMGADSSSYAMQDADDKKQAYEQRVARMLEDLLSRTLGYGRVRAEVSADLDFDKVVSNEERYDPDGQVVRSTQTSEENGNSSEGKGNDSVSVASNLPNANATNGAGGTQSSSANNRTEETVNYEISKIVKSHVREPGQIKRLSVAILVDGLYETGADGASVYKPRPADELEKIQTLVQSAIGYSADRGDTVEVVNLRFASAEDSALGETDQPLFMGMGKEDLFRVGEMATLAVVAILVLLLVVRPVIMRAMESIPSGAGMLGGGGGTALLAGGQMAGGQQGLLGGGGMVAGAAPGSSAGAVAAAAAAAAMEEEEAEMLGELEQMINIDRVEGRVRASSMRKVGEIVEKHPEEAVAIIRNWLYQES